jgi:hypothetical protein
LGFEGTKLEFHIFDLVAIAFAKRIGCDPSPSKGDCQQRHNEKQQSQAELWPLHAIILSDRRLSVAAGLQAADSPENTERDSYRQWSSPCHS